MNESTGQNNTKLIVSLLVAGTASMFSNSFNDNSTIPMQNYDYEYRQSPDLIDYTLSHERLQVPVSIEPEDPLIGMPPSRKISVKFNRIKIIPLEFTSVEDNEGFIE